MKITYEADLDDVTETPLRLFMRTPGYQRNKWIFTAIYTFFFGLFAVLGFHDRPQNTVVALTIAAAVWGAAMNLLTYKNGVRRRIKKHVATETEGHLPATTSYEAIDDKVIRTSFGVSATFYRSELDGVKEDKNYIELSYGEKGLCVIPLRALPSDAEKDAFIAAVRG